MQDGTPRSRDSVPLGAVLAGASAGLAVFTLDLVLGRFVSGGAAADGPVLLLPLTASVLVAAGFVLLARASGRSARKARPAPSPPGEGQSQGQRAYRRLDQQLSLLIDSIPGTIVYVDARERYVRVNRDLREMFGLPPEVDVRGMTVREAVGPEVYEQSRELIRRALAGENFRIEGEFRIPGIGARFYESFFIPDVDDAGRVAGFLMMGFDITARKASEVAVRESERRFRELCSLTPHGIMEVDRDGVILFSNPANDRLVGAESSPITGLSIDHFYRGEARRAEVREFYSYLMESTPAPYRLIEYVHTLDERDIVLQIDWNYRRDPDDAVVGLVAVATDITSALATERARAETETLYRDASRLGGFGYWFRDISSGRITFSDEMYQMYGLDRESFSHQLADFLTLVHPDDLVGILDCIQTALKGPDPVSFEYRLRRPDGRERNFRAVAVCERDAEGKPWRMRGTVYDITDLKSAQRRTRAERDLNRRLIDTAPVMILLLDPLGRIVEFNKHMASLCGRSPQAVRGRDWISTFIPCGERGRHSGELNDLGSGRLEGEAVHPILTADGTVRLVQWRFTGLDEPDGARIGTLGVGVDLTERVALENAVIEAAASEQNRISRDLHDGVGQQLTGLGMMAEGVARRLRREASPHADSVDLIREGIYGALAEVGEAVRDLSPSDLKSGGLSSALRALCERSGARTGFVCDYHCSGEAEFIGEAEAGHLLRIAQEAVNNAIRHSGGSKIGVRLDCRVEESELIIYDDGDGVRTDGDGFSREGGHGLKTMRHRASVIGAALQIERGESGGARVRCILPNRQFARSEPAHGNDSD